MNRQRYRERWRKRYCCSEMNSTLHYSGLILLLSFSSFPYFFSNLILHISTHLQTHQIKYFKRSNTLSDCFDTVELTIVGFHNNNKKRKNNIDLQIFYDSILKQGHFMCSLFQGTSDSYYFSEIIYGQRKRRMFLYMF